MKLITTIVGLAGAFLLLGAVGGADLLTCGQLIERSVAGAALIAAATLVHHITNERVS